jgi:ribulose 1,5-bisphosphate carboxylase large subunit-like protein
VSVLFDGEEMIVDEKTMQMAFGWMSRNPEALAQSIATRQHVEAWLKVVEATEKGKWKGEAANVQEREARSSEAYKLALVAVHDATAAEQKLRYTWQLCETAVDIWRTKCANERKF